MDCNTARVYLQLGGTDADELRQHLGECSACTHLAQDMQRLDQHLGRAMRAVEVPRGPKEQLLYRLAAEQGDRQRRWVAYALRGAAAVAAALLLTWGVVAILGPAKAVVSGQQVVHDFNILRPYQDASNYQLKLLGARGKAPSFVNYAYLIGEPSLAILPGTQDDKKPVEVPQFYFSRGEQRAVVYVVPSGKFTVEEVDSPDPAYPWQLQIERDEENPGYMYLVLHNGKDWGWLRRAE